jgi:hypothetical protein
VQVSVNGSSRRPSDGALLILRVIDALTVADDYRIAAVTD